MSYRNPRFFKEDYTLINRSFQQAFTSAYKGAQEYYDNIEKEQEEYESDVQVRSDLMKQDIAGLKGLQAGTQAEILRSVNEFYEDATRIDLGGKKRMGLFAKNLDQERRSDTDLDLAAQNFSAAAQPLNALFQVLPELDEKGGLNKSSETYLEYAAVIKAARNGFQSKNPEIAKQFNFQSKGNNDFDMNIRIENPKWRNGDPIEKKYIDVDSKLLASYIGNNNPADLERYKEAYSGDEGVVQSIKADFETRANEMFADGMVPAKDENGFSITPEKYLKSSVDEYVDVVRASAEGIPGGESMITDIFNNSVNFGYSKRYSMLVEAGETSEALRNLANLAEGDTGKNGIFEKREMIADLLETKHNDTSLNTSMLKKLGLKGQNLQTTVEALNKLKDDMVSEKIYLDLYGQGLTSKYRQADEVVEPDLPEPEKPTRGAIADNTLDNNALGNMNEIARFVGETGLEAIDAGEDFVGPKVPSLVNRDEDFYSVEEGKFDDAKNIFQDTEVRTKDGVRYADDVKYDPKTKILAFGYDQKRGIKTRVEDPENKGQFIDTYGDLPESTQDFDLSNPDDFKKLYMARGTNITSANQSRYENNYNKFKMSYAKNNLYRFILDTGTTAGDVHIPSKDNKFGERGSMHRWVSLVAQQDPAFFINAMDNAAKGNKDLFNKLKDQYVKYGGRTITVKALMVELETKNL